MADESNIQFSNDPELERAKAWWKEHGRPIVAGVVVGLSAVAGFNYWQYYQQTQAEEASVLYERLRDEIEVDAETETETETEGNSESKTAAETDAGDVEVIEAIAAELMANYAATPYATHAAFALAKSAVDAGDLDNAAQALEWVLDNTDDDGMLHVARLRLASVLLSKGEADLVVTLLYVKETGGFFVRYSELTGDAHLQQGDIDAARSAYQSGLDALSPTSDGRTLLELKLNNLGG